MLGFPWTSNINFLLIGFFLFTTWLICIYIYSNIRKPFVQLCIHMPWIQMIVSAVKSSKIYNYFLSKNIYIHHHHHHIALVARISLTLSRHSSLSFIALGRSSGQHPVSSHSCWMYVRAGRPAFARPCVGILRVHLLWVHLCFSSSVLHVWFVWLE